MIWLRVCAVLAFLLGYSVMTLTSSSPDRVSHLTPAVQAHPSADSDDNKERRNLRTNELGQDAFEIEGEIISVHCNRKPPEIIIGTLDGAVTIRVMKNKKQDDNFDCEEAHRGDYLTVEHAQKHHEYLYDGYKFELEHECEEEDDNDNSEDCEEHDDDHKHRGSERGDHRHDGPEHAHDYEKFEVVQRIGAGNGTQLASPDGLIGVEIRAGTMPKPLIVTLRSAEHPESEPPGVHVGEITFELRAEDDTGSLAQLASAVTVTVRYHDEDAEGLDKRRFALAVWDQTSNQWVPLPSTASADSNQVSAPSTRLGSYPLYQRR